MGVSSKGLVDWMLYFIFSLFFRAYLFLPMNERIGVCKIKGDIGFFVFENKRFTGRVLQTCGDVIRLKVLCSVLINSISLT